VKGYGPTESGFNIAIRKDERFTLTLTAVDRTVAAQVAKVFWGIVPGSVARMLGLVGPLDAAGGF
jgi:hypothetical protein